MSAKDWKNVFQDWHAGDRCCLSGVHRLVRVITHCVDLPDPQESTSGKRQNQDHLTDNSHPVDPGHWFYRLLVFDPFKNRIHSVAFLHFHRIVFCRAVSREVFPGYYRMGVADFYWLIDPVTLRAPYSFAPTPGKAESRTRSPLLPLR